MTSSRIIFSTILSLGILFTTTLWAQDLPGTPLPGKPTTPGTPVATPPSGPDAPPPPGGKPPAEKMEIDAAATLSSREALQSRDRNYGYGWGEVHPLGERVRVPEAAE